MDTEQSLDAPQLTKLTSVATACEARFIVAVLEDRGIPAVAQTMDSFSGYLLYPHRVCVRKTELEHAREELQAARYGAQQRGVSDAFGESPAAASRLDDSFANEFDELQKAPPDERDRLMSEYVAGWLIEGVGYTAIAERMLLAGYDKQHALDLLNAVEAPQADVVSSARIRCVMAGLWMAGVAAALLVLWIFFPIIGIIPFFLPLTVSLVVAGLALSYEYLTRSLAGFRELLASPAENQTLQADRVESAEVDQDQIAQIFAHAGQIPQPHPNLPSDLVMTEMVRLQSVPAQERNEALEPYMESWIQRGADALTVARYLAAAGLTHDDAAQLENLVRTRVAAEWRGRARIDFFRAIGAFAAAGILMMIETISRASFPGYGIVLIAFCALGMALLTRSIRLMRRVTAAPEEFITPNR